MKLDYNLFPKLLFEALKKKAQTAYKNRGKIKLRGKWPNNMGESIRNVK